MSASSTRPTGTHCSGWCSKRWGPWSWSCVLNSSSGIVVVYLSFDLFSFGCFVVRDLASWVAGIRCSCLSWFRSHCCSLLVEHYIDQSASPSLFEYRSWSSPSPRRSSFLSRISETLRTHTLYNKRLQQNSNPPFCVAPSSLSASASENPQFSNWSASPSSAASLDQRCWIPTHAS